VTPDTDPSPTSALRYFAWLYSPPDQQPLLKTLLALESDIRDVLKPGLEHRVSHVRMEWWQAEVERFANGKPAHPLTRALSEANAKASASSVAIASPHGASRSIGARLDISGLVDTTIWDLASATFGTRAEVAGYCERWASAMIAPLAPSLAGTLGSTIREIELLCDLAPEARAGRLRLPLDELERDGIDVESLAKPPWPAKLCALLMGRHRALRAALAGGVASVPREQQPATRGLLVWVALAYRRSLLAERALPDSAQQLRFALLKEVWAAWRAARRASQGTFELTQESTT
jgi:phytoene synthase